MSMRILALDIGRRKTGMAFFDSETEVPFPLETCLHHGKKQLVEAVRAVCSLRRIQKLVIGLPLLPSGEIGAQANFVKSVADDCACADFSIEYIDERYTSDSALPNDHAKAACDLLALYLARKK